MNVSHPEIVDAVRRALEEDIGAGDITTQSVRPGRCHGYRPDVRASIPDAGGCRASALIFDDCVVRPASPFRRAPRLAATKSPACAVPAGCCSRGERTALNFVQRLSGIATLTGAYVRAVEGTGCRILDTRKTTPGLRRLEKMAAAAGGAVNHRMGLYDAMLIKNNHIAAAGGVRAALERTRRGVRSGIEVEIEVRTHTELDEALACGADSSAA